ncbi:MAG TPA: GGDEF domain-containing protein [Anaerolineales bacterium]|nr:GGDEF domain-containing protein [Anaerolineales bacterium]
MSKRAWLYCWFIIIAGSLMAWGSLLRTDFSEARWATLLVLAFLATAAQLFKSEAPTHQIYHPSLGFGMALVLLFDPGWYVLVVVATHLLEWAKEVMSKSQHLRAWYIQPFNISVHIICGLVAWLVFRLVNPVGGELDSLRAMAGAGLGALAYVMSNHLMVGEVLVLARSVTWRESGILDFENLSTDYVMLALGFVFANLVTKDPWLIVPALTPLYLISRALAIPILKQQVNTDAKTGLWNAKYFMKALESEMNRAQRFNRPLTVVMADLDFLRNINNAYGHLAGDAVLSGAAQILKAHFREYDVVARFGGEEFSVLMPETTPVEAFSRIEAIRAAIQAAEFEAPTTHVKVKATMSFGLAEIESQEQSVKELIHCADVAVYQAKLEGRNCTKIFSADVAYSMGIFSLEENESKV